MRHFRYVRSDHPGLRPGSHRQWPQFEGGQPDHRCFPGDVKNWCEFPRRPRIPSYCMRCAPEPSLPEPQWEYAYLLGLYLGDGCISVGGDAAKDVWRLRIACADARPGLKTECQAAISAIRPGNKVGMVQQVG